MLAETCPRPNCSMPLARSRAGRVYCSACKVDVRMSSSQPVPAEQPAEEPTTEAPTLSEAQTGTRSDGIIAVRSGSTVPDVSTALTEKLLEGWTLLNTVCSTCNTPLLRSRTGALLCVRCAAVGAAAAAAASNTLPPTAAQAQPAIMGPSARASLPPPRSSDEPRNSRLPHRPVRLGLPEPELWQDHRQCDDVLDPTYMELCKSETAVVAALRTLREGLDERRDVNGISVLVNAIGDCAATIEKLRNARARVLSNT